MQRARRDQKGFVLVIVAVCGVAMLIIAMAVVMTSGAGQLNAIKDVNSDRSSTIAESGMQRATAYASAIIAAEKDFDLALDPSLSVNCGAPSSPIAPGTPRYTDAVGTAEWPPGSGINFQMVAFGDGAYLTRFDDDMDDMLPNAQLGAFSGNTPANGCAEGPGVINNPFRDRNRAVWISVIGIYPGINPVNAKHHTALRRLYIANASTPPSLIRVGGNLTTGHLKFCSETGDIAVHGNATLSNQTDTCGTLQATSTITNSSQPADCSAHGISCSHGTDTSGIVFSDPVTVPGPTSNTWYTWSSSCNFSIDATGFYFWDSATPACAAWAGGPPATTNTCWIPLIYVVGGAPADPLGWPETITPTEWKPDGTISATVLALPATGPQSGRVFGSAPTHPLWSSCQGATPFDWRPPNGAAGGSASPACACTGTHAASFAGTTFTLDPASPSAVPAGVYFFNGNRTFTSMGLGLPGTDANESDWPQATIVVSGNATFSGSGRIGIGTKRGPSTPPPPVEYPSVVVGGNLTVDPGANWAFGGAVWAASNATFSNGSNVELYGPLTVAGNLTVGNGGKLDVVVTTDMVQAVASSVAVAATGSRTLR